MSQSHTEATGVSVTKLTWEWYEKPRYPMHDTQPTLRMGKWDVGFIGYDWTSLAPRGCRHVAYVSLPGVKATIGHYGTVKEAKQAVQNAVHYWFYHLILRGNEDGKIVKRISRTRSAVVEPKRVRRVREQEVERVRRAPRSGF